jgi:hypothetical protein
MAVVPATPQPAAPAAAPAQAAPGQKKGIKLFGKFRVPGSIIGYGVLISISGASLMALYGVMLTFVLKTVPPDKETEKTVDPTGIMRKLKQAMVGLICGVIAPLFIITVIVGSGIPKGLLRSEVFLFMTASLMALVVLSTALAYTQDQRVEDTPTLKTGVLGALIGSSVVTAALALAGGIEFLNKRKQAGANAKNALAKLRAGNLKGVSAYFIKPNVAAGLTADAKTLQGDAQAANAAKQTHAQKHAAHQAAKQAAKQAKAAQKAKAAPAPAKQLPTAGGAPTK